MKMPLFPKKWRSTIPLILGGLLLCNPSQADLKTHHFSFDTDNDSLIRRAEGQGRDKDYTYSLGLGYTRFHHTDSNWFIHRPLGVFNRALIGEPSRPVATHFSTGLYGFTPQIKSLPMTYYLERPYAGLTYFSVADLYIGDRTDTALKSSFSLGLLGLDIVRNIQNAYHKQVGFNTLKGWARQLSSGGEPTLKYNLEWQSLFASPFGNMDIMHAFEGSAGYITEANYSLYMRFGLMNSPWWTYQPTVKNYGEKHISLASNAFESYWVLGVINRLRAYNVFLNGQFSEKDHAVPVNNAKPFIMGVWLGWVQNFKGGFRLSYHANFQTSEVNSGRANRSMTWGSLLLTQSF